MKPYPIELRERIIAAVDKEEYTIEEIAEIFGVKERFIYRMLSKRRELGHIAPQEHGGGAVAKMNEQEKDALAAILRENADATLEELKELLKKQVKVEVSISTIWRRLKDLKLTLKKRRK